MELICYYIAGLGRQSPSGDAIDMVALSVCVCVRIYVCSVHISEGGVSHPMSFRLTRLVSTGLSVSFLWHPHVFLKYYAAAALNI